MSAGIMDTKPREAERYSEEGSGKKKSKFKSFKKFFVKKKKKETLPSLVKIGLKPSQSASDVTASESMLMDYDSEEEMRSLKGILGNRALSHDSIFIPEPVQESSRPVRVFSQENVSENIRALQLKIQHKIKLISPTPFAIPAKRMDDAGTSSEDDGLPRSPQEMSLLHETIICSTTSKFSDSYQRLSSLSLAGTGSEEEEQISSGPSSRPLSPEYQPLHKLTGARAVYSETLDDNISPSADFDVPPQFFACLDSSAAKHRLSIKPRHQRANNARRPSSRTRSMSLTDLSCTLEEEEEDEKWTLAEQQTLEDRMPQISDTAYAEHPGIPQNVPQSLEDESAGIEMTFNDASSTMLELTNAEQNVLTDAKIVESKDHDKILEANLDEKTMEQEPSEELNAYNEDMEVFTNSTNPERNLLSVNVLQKGDRSTAQTPDSLIGKEQVIQEVAGAAMVVSASGQVHKEAAKGGCFGKQLPKKSSLKHSDLSSHGNKIPSDIPQMPPSSKFEMTSWPLGKSKSVGELFVPDVENSQSVVHSGVCSEKKTEKIANELTALRKFSVSSAWERPRTGSFNTKGNLDGESLKNTKLSVAKVNAVVPKHEKTKEDVCSIKDHPERKLCIKQEPLAPSESRPVDKLVPRASQKLSTPLAMSDSSIVSKCQSDSEDKSVFQVKLRSTSLSLRYRESYCIESKAAEKNRTEYKSEQECHATLSKADRHLQVKTASEVNTGSSLNDNGKSKAQSSEHFYEKPPLPRKPVLLNTSISNTNMRTEKATKSSDSKPENKDSEKRSLFSKAAVPSPVSSTESARGPDSQTKPTWINLAQQKQRDLEDQKLNAEEKHSSWEGDTDKKNKEKERTEGHIRQQTELIKNKLSHSVSKTAEECKQETKPKLEELRQRANTLPHLISATQSSLLLEKEERVQFKQTNPSSSDQPSWMELAKKKSQAWSDMPQIIK